MHLRATRVCSRAWRVKLLKTPGTQVFTLKKQGKVVGRKTLTIKIRA